jgi:hypothetical protein
MNMAKLTKLDSHPARPGKLRVYIDDKYAFELSRKSILALKVNEGEELVWSSSANCR